MTGERRATLTATKMAEAKMMKARGGRGLGEQAAASGRLGAKAGDAAGGANGAAGQQAAAVAAQARKRRSSINVYDQPSSLNSRLRQLETDMLRLDEDRTKLFDDTHSALAQYELKLGEIHAILKSRQDNVEKYVEDMKLLLQAKEEFEKQTKLLNEKHDRIHEKFMHRETIISREIKLLKNKFEVLEKNRQFRSMLQKSANQITSGDNNDDLTSGLEAGPNELASGAGRKRHNSETATIQTGGELDSFGPDGERLRLSSSAAADLSRGAGAAKSVRIQMSKLGGLGRLLAPLFSSKRRRRQKSARAGSSSSRLRGKSNKISSLDGPAAAGLGGAPADGALAQLAESAGEDEGATMAPAASHLDQQPALAVTETLEAAGEAPSAGDERQRQAGAMKLGGFMKRLFG